MEMIKMRREKQNGEVGRVENTYNNEKKKKQPAEVKRLLHQKIEAQGKVLEKLVPATWASDGDLMNLLTAHETEITTLTAAVEWQVKVNSWLEAFNYWRP